MTDMQGFDFEAVSSAGEELFARVPVLQTEVWRFDVMSYEAHNDLCRDWLPFMTKLGYELHDDGSCKSTREAILEGCKEQLRQNPQRPPVSEESGIQECDAVWIRKGHDVTFELTMASVPFNMKPQFTAEEYAKCQ